MRHLGMVAVVVLCMCAASFGAISVTGTAAPYTLVYNAPTDLSTQIDPTGVQADITESFGVAKATFQALNPQVVAFDAATGSFTNQLGGAVVNYSATGIVTFAFPAPGNYAGNFSTQAGYNYGGPFSVGRQAFSGPQGYSHIAAVPSKKDDGSGANMGEAGNCLDIKISSTGDKGVGAIGFCVSTRQEAGAAASTPVVFTLSDIATGAVSDDTTTIVLPDFGLSTAHQKFFIGYQAPTGKVITRVQIEDNDTMTPSSYHTNLTMGIDDLSFVMVPTQSEPVYPIGDINRDHDVNAADLQLLVAAWTSGPDYAGAEDINADGYVNVGDLQILIAHWGEHLE